MKTAPAGGMSVDGPEFRKAVTDVIQEFRPRRIIETGTYLGLGTTQIIATALGWPYEFFTIEANKAFCAEATKNLAKFPSIRVLNGYSIPRSMIPSERAIALWLRSLEREDIFVDFQEHERVGCYRAEGGNDVPCAMLNVCFRYFGGSVDLMMLDSSGHLGTREFLYSIRMLRSRCVFVLDDTNHVKHFRSLKLIKQDPRFTLLVESDEKFGFCVATFQP